MTSTARSPDDGVSVECPSCGQGSLSGARFCADCGGDLAATTPRASAQKPWLRVLLTVVYVALAYPLYYATSSAPVDQRPFICVLVALFALAVVGTINWVIQRLRKRGRSWLMATFSIGPLVFALVLAVAQGSGQSG